MEEEIPARKATAYDQLERPMTESLWSKNEVKWVTTHSHQPGVQTVDPPNGEQASTRISDVQGRMTELRTYNTPGVSTSFDKTTYTYNKAGQISSMTDAAGNQWRYEYDLRGRRTKAVEPDRGVTTYTHTDLDQVATMTDALGKTLFYSYDTIGRQTSVREGAADGPLLIERTYDNLVNGSPSTATRYVNGEAYKTEVTGYDSTGHALGTKVTLPASEGGLARTYTTESTYTASGQLATLKVPGVGGLPAETLTTTYDSNDLPKTMSSDTSTYVTDSQFNSFGDLTYLEVKPTGGKYLRHNYVYDDSTRRLTRAFSQRQTTGPQRVLDQSYDYDLAGNVTKITDSPASGSADPKDVQCFGYDESRRLTQAWTPGDENCAAQPTSASQLGGPAPYWHQWTFDQIGNRKTEKRNTVAGATTSTYEYPAAGEARPHAVQKITTTGTDGTTKVNEYGYDAVGNQTTRKVAGVGETFTWDTEGKLAKVKKGNQETGYIYDADGNRLLRKDNTGTTLYLGDTEVLLMPDGSELGTRYYKFGQQTIGVRVGTKLTWLGSDHHGSATLTVDAQTQAFQRKRITPYGEARGPIPTAWPGQKDFVGGTRDDSTGLVHLGAREYDPTTGRFVSVDPVIDGTDPQQLNGYAYANNSPASFVDADGKRYRVQTITISETKRTVREHVRRIKEIQKEVITIYAKIVIFTFFAKIATAFGMHEFARQLTAEVAVQVIHFKEVIKTIRYHTSEIIRIVTTKRVYIPELEQALKLAKQTDNSVSTMDKQVDGMADIAAKLAERAKASLDAIQKATAIADEQKRKDAEQANRKECGVCGKDPDDDPIDKIAWNAVGGAAVGVGICVLGAIFTAGGSCAVGAAVGAGIAGAGATAAYQLGWNCYNGPKNSCLKRDPYKPPPMTYQERSDLCHTPGAQEACKYATPGR
ncbi:RHS repeat-associated core domain-containing protein [Kribbella sp. NBC_01505]|uniref:RHS repeat domain-containing protein n=1 Tax=Kribbella sp. NBC_01505 TaxID=2903580 RepID=UPI00386366AA